MSYIFIKPIKFIKGNDLSTPATPCSRNENTFSSDVINLINNRSSPKATILSIKYYCSDVTRVFVDLVT